MDFLLNKIVEWIKDILVGGIMDNLNGLFDGINGQVAGIAGTVGATPQSWNSSVFNMIKGLSDNIIVPVAGIVLTAVMCYELIQMVIDRNSLHDFETFVFFKWVVKALVSVLIVSHTWDIILGIFDVAQHVVDASSGLISGSTEVDAAALADLRTTLETLEVGELLGIFMQSFIVQICSMILSVVIFVIVYGRMMEIYLLTSLAPIPFSTFGNREQSHIGQNYLRSLFALGFQGFLIMICIGIYAVMVQSISFTDDIMMSIWGVMGYTVLLCFALFKTGSLARSVMSAH